MTFSKAYELAKAMSIKNANVFVFVIGNVESIDGKCKPTFRVASGGQEFDSCPVLEAFEGQSAAFVNGEEWGF